MHNSNISTYKNLLLTIQKFEKDEEKYKRLLFVCSLICSFISFIIIILVIHYNIHTSFRNFLLSADFIKCMLLPLLGFLLASYEKDHIDKRRAELINLIINNFNPNDIPVSSFDDAPIQFGELKTIIYNILNDKL